MAVLNLRNVPETTHQRLRLLAARHGRSMESEARAILEASLRPARSENAPALLADWVDTLYRGKPPKSVVDDLIAERRREGSVE